MTLIIEDGSIVLGAQSYVTEAQWVAYCAARGFTVDISTADQYLILAMDYLEQLQYIGMQTQQGQALQWPRRADYHNYYGLYDFGYGCGFGAGQLYIDRYPIGINFIPQQLMQGEMEAALQVWKGNDPLQDVQRKTTMEKVGPIEVQYGVDSSSYTLPYKINRLLYKLLRNGGTGSNFSVSRG